jgi:hypothetical protein
MDPEDYSNTELLEIEKEMSKARQPNTIVVHLPFQPIFVAWLNMAQPIPAPHYTNNRSQATTNGRSYHEVRHAARR